MQNTECLLLGEENGDWLGRVPETGQCGNGGGEHEVWLSVDLSSNSNSASP